MYSQQIDGNGFEALPVQDESWIEIEVPYDDIGQDNCGTAAVALTEQSELIKDMLYNGIYRVQHRGQEAAGIAVIDSDGRIQEVRGVGLVPQALPQAELQALPPGRFAVAHTRYGTIPGLPSDDETALQAAMPAVFETNIGSEIALGLNGNITNPGQLGEKFGVDPDEHITDGFVLAACIAAARRDNTALWETTAEVLEQAEGAYAITLAGEDQVIGMRDPYGFRPLMLGSFGGDVEGFGLISESHAFEPMGAEFRRELARGEMIVCNSDGKLESKFPFSKRPDSLCAMELIYLYGPQGELKGRNVYMVRKELGKMLAEQSPVDADVVIGVPDSGIPASIGYAHRLGLPRVEGVLRDKYAGSRNFITPGQQAREGGIQKKLIVVPPEVYGRRVVVVDDSIVRGTTTKSLIEALRRRGAKEVHLRSSAPKIKYPCFYGMDFPTEEELVANRYDTNEAIAEYLNADSVAFLSIEGLHAGTNAAGKLCLACMNSNYPTRVPYPTKK